MVTDDFPVAILSNDHHVSRKETGGSAFSLTTKEAVSAMLMTSGPISVVTRSVNGTVGDFHRGSALKQAATPSFPLLISFIERRRRTKEQRVPGIQRRQCVGIELGESGGPFFDDAGYGLLRGVGEGGT
jgi:hypothetical protein